MVVIGIFLTLLCFIPSCGYAFNSIVMMDPAFQVYIMLYLPLIGAIAMSLWEMIWLRLWFKQAYGIKQCIKLTFLHNCCALFVYMLVSLCVLLVLKDILLYAKHPAVIWLAVVYFGSTYVYFSAQKKIAVLQTGLALSYAIDQHKRVFSMYKGQVVAVNAFKYKIYLVNTVSYMMIYGYLTMRL